MQGNVNTEIKFTFLSEKKENCTGLLSTSIFELKQMNSDKVMDGGGGSEM